MRHGNEASSLLGSGSGSDSPYESFKDRMMRFLRCKCSLSQLFQENDDFVSFSVRRFIRHLSLSVCLWLLSFTLISLQIIKNGEFIKSNVWLFFPMWLGTFLGILSAIRSLLRLNSNVLLVSRERRLILRAQGFLYKDKLVEYDSLPLMRTLITWNIVLIVSFLVAFISQVLYYLWFIHSIIEMEYALIPTSLVLFFYMIFVYIFEVFSPVSCLVFSLLMVELTLFTLKTDGKLLTCSWNVICLPMALVLVICGRYLLELLHSMLLGVRYYLTNTQRLCIVLYALAFTLASSAEVMNALSRSNGHGYGYGNDDGEGVVDGDGDGDGYVDGDQNNKKNNYIDGHRSHDPIPIILWILSSILICIAALIILNVECNAVATSRGYTDPIPLMRSQQGWEPLAVVQGKQPAEDLHNQTWWLMLGLLPLKPRQSLYAAAGYPTGLQGEGGGDGEGYEGYGGYGGYGYGVEAIGGGGGGGRGGGNPYSNSVLIDGDEEEDEEDGHPNVSDYSQGQGQGQGTQILQSYQQSGSIELPNMRL